MPQEPIKDNSLGIPSIEEFIKKIAPDTVLTENQKRVFNFQEPIGCDFGTGESETVEVTIETGGIKGIARIEGLVESSYRRLSKLYLQS